MLIAVGYPFVYLIAVLIEYGELSIDNFVLTCDIGLFQGNIGADVSLSVAYYEQLISAVVEVVTCSGILVNCSLNAFNVLDSAAVRCAVIISLNRE